MLPLAAFGSSRVNSAIILQGLSISAVVQPGLPSKQRTVAKRPYNEFVLHGLLAPLERAGAGFPKLHD
jgi:hypothetical protein